MKQLKCTSIVLALGIAFFMTLTSSHAGPGEKFKRVLQNDPSITSLEIDGEISSEEDFAKLLTLLKTNTFLNEITIIHNNIGNDKALQLTRTLCFNKHITNFTFTFNKVVTEVELFIQELIKNPRLKLINLRGSRFKDKGLRTLFQFLATNPVLTHLDLTGNEITVDGIQVLTSAMATNDRLYDLELGVNDLGDLGVQKLAIFLQRNTTLGRLNLRDNKISINGISYLMAALTTNTTLVSLGLSSNKIGDEGIALLVDMMLKNPALQELELRYNKITSQGARKLAELLQTNNTRVKKLDLSYNDLGDDGVIAIAHALRSNTTLTTLNLTRTNIGDRAALAMIEALSHNQALSHLHICNRNITDQTTLALAEYLKNNHTLVELNFVCNGITNQGVIAILRALTINNTLREASINTENLKITKELIEALIDLLAVNTNIANLYVQLDFRGEENHFILERRLLNALYHNQATLYDLIFWSDNQELTKIRKMIQQRNELKAELTELRQRANGTTLFERRIGEINTTLTDLEQRLAEAMHNLNEQPETPIFEDQEIADQEIEEEEEAKTTAEEDRTNEPEINFAIAHNAQLIAAEDETTENFILEFDENYLAAAQNAQPAAAAPYPTNPFAYLFTLQVFPGLPPAPNSSSSFGSIF